MHEEPGYSVLKKRFKYAASVLGTVDPSDYLGGVIDDTFSLPLSNPKYGQNALVPGSLPIEFSFSEMAAETFRLDFEPFVLIDDPDDRRNEVTRNARQLIQDGFGNSEMCQFDRLSEQWRKGLTGKGKELGAFLGATFGKDGLSSIKVYYPLDRSLLAPLQPALVEMTKDALATLPGTSPLFLSIACGPGTVSQRIYLVCWQDLRLLDLKPIFARAGIGHRLPDLICTALALDAGGFALPCGGALLGISEGKKGMELKLEIILRGTPMSSKRVWEGMQQLLAQRPRSQRVFQRWLNAMGFVDRDPGKEMTVVSVRVAAECGTRLNVYLSPSEEVLSIG